jgi:molybdate transport system substrate-binding protein
MIRRTALAAAFCLAAPAMAGADEVVVFAAASLKSALDQVAAGFGSATGHRVVISYGGSGQMAQQIIAGAPADIFIAAAPEWMAAVADEVLVVTGTRKDLLGNTLVLIAHGPDAPPLRLGPELLTALGDGRLAMGMTASVPVGQYGKAALQGLGLWETIAPRVVEAENARAALMLVASGEAPLGIVFASDAHAIDAVTVIAAFPAESHPPIRYQAALLTNAADPADRAFLAALSTVEAAALFRAHGFEVLP